MVSLDAIDLVEYARARWRFVALACGTAMLLTLAAALMLPRRYTATATILIQPPAETDSRAATAISPVYLESLRTYERVASSDTLFLEAARRLDILSEFPGQASESIRKRVLDVTKPRETKVLEIKATLPQAVKAQALAQYIAEKTVERSRALDREAQEPERVDAQRMLAEAQARATQIEKTWADTVVREPVAALESSIESLIELQGRIERDLVDARADLADFAARPDAATQVPAVRARIAALTREQREVATRVEQCQRLIETRTADRSRLEAEQKAARTQLDAASARWREIQASAALHGERLELIDPGIVPGRPSFPNVPLMLVAAPLLAGGFSFAWLALSLGMSRRLRTRAERAYRAQYQS